MGRYLFLLFLLIGLGPMAGAFTLNSSDDPTLKGWSNPRVTFRLNPSDCPANINDLISNSLNLWNGIASSELEVVMGAPTNTTYAQLMAGTATDVPVIICDPNFSTNSGLGGDGVAGVALVVPPPRGGHISYAFLLINVDPSSSGNVSSMDPTLASVVVAHEIGHVLGLGHSQDTNALMYFNASDKAHLSLAQDDIDGITYLYPRDELGDKFMGCGSVGPSLGGGGPNPGTPVSLFLIGLPLALGLWMRTRRRREFRALDI